MTTRRSLFAAAAAVVPLVAGVAVVQAATPKRPHKTIAYLQQCRQAVVTSIASDRKLYHAMYRQASNEGRAAEFRDVMADVLERYEARLAELDDMLAELEAPTS